MQPSGAKWRPGALAWALLALLVVGALGNVVFSSTLYDWPSGDEYWHYSYSSRLLATGATERESVHNYNSTTPAMVLNALAVEGYQAATGNRVFSKVAARAPQWLWYLSLVVGVGVLGARIGNPAIAWWAVFLSLLDPSLNGHGSVIGTDVPFAAMAVWFFIALVWYLEDSSWGKAALLGIVLGLAFCVKYSALFLILPLVLAALLHVFVPHGLWLGSFRVPARAATVVSHGMLVALLAGVVVNVAYVFAGIGVPLGAREWYSEPFKELAAHLPLLPSPLAMPFLSGFDHQLAAERTWSWNVIVLGDLHPNGVWYYFVVAWLLKTTSGVIVLTALACMASWRLLATIRRINAPWLLIASSWVTFLLYFSFVFRTQVGLRYAFVCLPLGYLLVAGVIAVWAPKRAQLSLVVAVALIAAVELPAYAGNTIAFTNSFLPRKDLAYRYIADSNIDWFQHRSRVHEDAARAFGDFHLNPQHILPGYNVIELNRLAGVMRNFDQYQWVRNNLEPAGNFRHTALWYHIDARTFEEFLAAERTFDQTERALDLCVEGYVYQEMEAWPSTVTLAGGQDSHPRLYTGCLAVDEVAWLELELRYGAAAIGTYPLENHCYGTAVSRGARLWFRFLPGVHPICAEVTTTIEATWILHRGSARFATRELLE